MNESTGEHSVHAFVDGEVDAAERERIFAAASADSRLRGEIDEVRHLKALVRHAYADAKPARRVPRASLARTGSIALAFVLGLSLGYLGAHREAGVSPLRTVHAVDPGTHAAGAVIQVAEGDPAKWRLAIEQAITVARQTPDSPYEVVLIAYGPGLGMLKADSPVRDELRGAREQGIELVACGQTMQRDHVEARELLPGVDVAKEGAALAILELQQRGFAYIRI
jgi:intracellular sulfur oxidation DsrE/DsrF family protein